MICRYGHEYVGRRCKKCVTLKVTQIRREQKQFLIKLFGDACVMCGYNKSVRALHFHHVDPTIKSYDLSRKSTINIVGLLREARKCILVCSNCHCEIEDGLIVIPLDAIAKSKKINPELFKRVRSRIKNRKIRTYVYKINWPSDDELQKLVWQIPTTKIATQLGVSDSAISKRCVKKNISKPPIGYWTARG